MPREAVAAFIASAVILMVLAYALGAFDSEAREIRFKAGACDIPGQKVEDAVTLTTQSAVGTGLYDSLDAPDGTAYAVPVRQELRICHVVTLATSVQRGFLEIGYGDNAASATSTAPTAAVTLAVVPAPLADEPMTVESIVGVVPAGKVPWVRHSPGVDWSAHAVGVLEDTD